MSIFAFFSINFFAVQRRRGLAPRIRGIPANSNTNPNPNSHIPLDTQQGPPPQDHNAQTGYQLAFPAEIVSVLILEFGILFHSVFIGLTLAVAGAEFKRLYGVFVLHQFFQGVGLGSRLQDNLGNHKRTKYAMALVYSLITPVSISAGLGVRASYGPGSKTALMVNGILDSTSAGILIYIGLVDLMANEFLFSVGGPVHPNIAFASLYFGACKNTVFHDSEMLIADSTLT
jgi:zinc transporter 1/2/3